MPDAVEKPKRRKVKPARSANEWVDVRYAGGSQPEPKRSRFGFGRSKGGPGTEVAGEPAAASAPPAFASGALPPLAAPAPAGRGPGSSVAPRGPTVTRQGDEILLREDHLPREEKLRLEGRFLDDPNRSAYEKGWVRTRSDTIDEIRTYVDSTLVRGARPPALSSRAHLRAGISELPGRPLSGEAAAIQIPGGENVVDRRVVYETRGGYVIAVTRKEGSRPSTDYYTISKVGDVEHALDALRDVRSVSQTVDTLPAPRESPLRVREGALPAGSAAAEPPADVALQPAAPEAPRAAATVPDGEPAAASPTRSEATAPASGAKSRFGTLASRLSLGRRKDASATAEPAPAPETGGAPEASTPAAEEKDSRFSALKGRLSFRRKRADGPEGGEG